eukprot:gene8839-8930_t
MREIADSHDNVWCTVGVHPHNAGEFAVPTPAAIAAEADHPKVIGIGESGLDYFYDKAPRDAQQDSFRAHIRAARLTGLPLAIHARNADDDIASILREETQDGAFDFLLHCFSSTRALAEAAIELGGYVSFSGILTFPKSQEIRDIALDVPLERILVETDSPYLAPVPFRGKRNEPAWVAHTAAVLAQGRMTLRVTLMGTGASAGVPLIGGDDGAGDWGVCDPAEPRNRRTRSSILLQKIAGETPESTILVDTSPDMRGQLLANRVRRADAILYTHAHADHVTGLDDVRVLNRITGSPVDAFGTAATLGELQARYAYAFRPWEPPGFFRPVMVPRVIGYGDTVEIAGITLALFEQDHGFMPTLGFRIGRFGYSTDAVQLDEVAFERLAGVETWVVGCYQRDPPHRTHAWLERIYEWRARLRPRRTVLTHMGTDMDWAWLQSHLPDGIEPGFDGMVLESD